MIVYIQLRDAMSSDAEDHDTPPRQIWLEAHYVEHRGGSFQFLDPFTMEHHNIYIHGAAGNDTYEFEGELYDFCFFRPRLLEGCEVTPPTRRAA